MSGASGYQVYRATSKSGKYSLVKTTTSTSFTDGKKTTGSTYYYKIRAYRTVSGKKIYGSFSDIVSVKLIPNTVKGVKASSASYSSLKISWSKVSDASGYQVYRATSKNGKYTLVKTTTGTSYTDTKRTTGTTYYYKIRAYKTVNGKKVYGSFSSVVYAKPALSKPGSITAKNAGSKKVKISWSKVSGASGYQVYYSTSKSGTYKLLKTTTSLYYTKSGLTKGKTYYFKVRAYRTVSGKKVYSSFTTVKSAKG